MSQFYVLIVGDKKEASTLNMITASTQVNLDNVHLPYFIVAEDETRGVAGVLLSAVQPEAVVKLKQHLPRPKTLDAVLIAEIEGFFSIPSSGLLDTIDNLHNFLMEHEGKLITCVNS